ncbi:MAG: KH domain-containing protein [Nitrospinae bacterium]|nr:KH domain-containing protein [Nitrospinota bacterium]MBF0635081.1 KH domain-containing protein [Nitrospinota bacterium]
MNALIERIARSLVDDPTQVAVTSSEDGDTTSLELRVAQDDLGKVIGRRGRTAAAMRTLLSATASKNDKRAVLEIVE